MKTLMKILDDYPPNYKKIEEAFHPPKNTVFTYGGTIYAPGIYLELPPDLLIHEETHMKQQADSVEAWWDRYIIDRDFRLSQEVPAYRNQYFYFKKHNDRNATFRFMRLSAQDLSGPMYGNMISFEKAVRMITS